MVTRGFKWEITKGFTRGIVRGFMKGFGVYEGIYDGNYFWIEFRSGKTLIIFMLWYIKGSICVLTSLGISMWRFVH